MQQHSAQRRQLQSQDEIHLCQQRDGNYSRKRRQSSRDTQTSIHHQYFHEDGWTNPQNELHRQPWVMHTMSNFHNKQSNWKLRLCSVCHEVWPNQVHVNQADDTNDPYMCTRCKRDKRVPT